MPTDLLSYHQLYKRNFQRNGHLIGNGNLSKWQGYIIKIFIGRIH